MTDTLASEWLKVRSVRSTYYILGVIGAIVVAAAALTWYAVHAWDGLSAAGRAHFALTPLDQFFTGGFVQLVLGVLGVLMITSEYATGMIRLTLTAVPRRRTLLAAKAAILAAIALVTGELSVTLSFLLSRLIVGRRPISGYTSPLVHEVPVLLATGLGIVVVALLGLGFGTILRSSAGAITTVVGVWYLLPIFALHLPPPWNGRVTAVMLQDLPSELAGAGIPTPPGTHTVILPPLLALGVLLVYVAAALGAAGLVLARRDV
jgi:hypothetical protein